MEALFRLGVLVLLLGYASAAFPATWFTSPFSFDPSLKTILLTESNMEGGTRIFYTLIVSSNLQAIRVQKYNTTTTIIVAFLNKVSPVSNVVLNLFSTTLIISFQIAGAYQVVKYLKSSLSQVSTVTTALRVGGLYLPTHNIFLRHETTETVVSQPGEAGETTLATFTTLTSNPHAIKYLSTQDQSKVFTFYTDRDYFLARDLTSVSAFASSFPSPLHVSLPSSGYQCVCLDSEGGGVFILDSNGILLLYSISTETVNSLVDTGYSIVTDCYYDVTTNSIIFVSSIPFSTIMYEFDLTSLTETDTSISLEGSFQMDFTQTVTTMIDPSSPTTVMILQVSNTPPCLLGQYYAAAAFTCNGCPTNCSSCLNSLTCTSCLTDNTIVTGSLCSYSPSPPSPPASIIEVVADFNATVNFIEIIDELINNTALKLANRIPGGRKMLPFLCFLVNLDELWLYQYHERNYGETMNSFFSNLQSFENMKWEILEASTTEVIYTKLGTSRKALFDSFDTKLNYTHPVFRQIEGRGETLLPACWEFLTFNLLFVLVAFFLLRWGFKMLFNYRISILLRPFSYLVFLSPMLLEGNLQYFIFLLFSQISMGFSLNPRDKMLNVLNYLLYFIIIWFSVVSCFLSFYLSKKLTKYILDNWRTRVIGLLTYSITNAMRMLVFGALHSLLRTSPFQLPLLATTEIIYLVFLVLSMSYWRMHKVSYKVWFNVGFTGLRLCLQLALFLQQDAEVVGSGSVLEDLFENSIGFLLVLYMITFYLATAWELTYELVELIKPVKTASQQSEEGKCQKIKQSQKKQQIKVTTKSVTVNNNKQNSSLVKVAISNQPQDSKAKNSHYKGQNERDLNKSRTKPLKIKKKDEFGPCNFVHFKDDSVQVKGTQAVGIQLSLPKYRKASSKGTKIASQRKQLIS